MSTPERFLHQRDSKLHSSIGVEATVAYLKDNNEQIPNQPDIKIAAYLGFLAEEQYVNDGILTGNKESITYQVDNNVIKPDDVPEAYFDLQRQIYREQGRGDITIFPSMRNALIENIRSDQRISLSQWANYLGNSDDVTYPDWFKTYVWSGVTRLADFDKEKLEFRRRSKGTTARYPDLNREALSYVYDSINRVQINGETLEDDELTNLARGANFNKLYSHAMLEVMPATAEMREQTEGSWTRYDQAQSVNGKASETAKALAESLKSRGTGWCTAGESTADMQLRAGDFYVFYTSDESGNYTVPRIAIRMERDKVAEVRGINPGQQLEGNMIDIATEKLSNLPGGEVYVKKASDMKQLTEIERKSSSESDKNLTNDQLRFLYEFDSKIEGFGYGRDPRIKEITDSRSFLADMAAIFGTNKRSKDVAQKMIETGHADYLVNNIVKFKSLDRSQVIYDLYEAGLGHEMLRNPDRFANVDFDALVKKFESEHGRQAAVQIIAENIYFLKPLDKSIAFELIDNGYVNEVFRLLPGSSRFVFSASIDSDYFPGLEPQELVDYLIGQAEYKTVITAMGSIPGIGYSSREDGFPYPIDATIAFQELIEAGELAFVVSHLKNVSTTLTELDFQNLADQLIDSDRIGDLVHHLNSFKGLDSVTANSLIMSGYITDVMTNISSFNALDNGTLVLLTKNGEEEYVINNLKRFKNLNSSLANQLIFKGHIDAVLNNISSFDLNPATRQRLGL